MTSKGQPHGMLVCMECGLVFPFHQLPPLTNVNRPRCKTCVTEQREAKRRRERQWET